MRGYEIDKGVYVQVEDEELDAIAIDSSQIIDIDVFVPSDQVEEASYVLLVGEIDATLDEEPEERARRLRRQIPTPYRCVAGMLLVVALAPLAHWAL